MKRQRALQVSGKTILITGAARGIGAHTARRLHAMGANVSLVGLEANLLSELASELGDRAAYFHADVTDMDALVDAAGGTECAFGGIDVVVANAGIAPPTTTIADIDVDAFERTINVDLFGVWRTVRATLPYITASRGHVVLLSSIYSFFNGALNASYAVSKAGVEQLGRALRVELAPAGATAGVAYFGFVETDMVEAAFAQPAAAAMRAALPAVLTRPIPLHEVVDRLVEGIERRSARITAPRWVAPALWARGPLAVLDQLMARNPGVHGAITTATGDSCGQ